MQKLVDVLINQPMHWLEEHGLAGLAMVLIIIAAAILITRGGRDTGPH